MKALYRISLLILCLLIPAAAHAGELDRQIDAVQGAYKGAEDISANFTQATYVKLLEKMITKKGRMYFKKGEKFRIEYVGPGEKNYVSDGTLLWVFVPNDDASLVTYEVTDETVPQEALKFLSGFGNLRKDFRVSPSKAFTDLKPGESAFYLTPKSRKAQYNALDAKFNQDGLVDAVQVHNKSGNISTYRFTDIRTSTGLAPSLFTHGSGKATPTTLPH